MRRVAVISAILEEPDISQQQFNEDVKTTMDDFEVPLEEAINMTGKLLALTKKHRLFHKVSD